MPWRILRTIYCARSTIVVCLRDKLWPATLETAPLGEIEFTLPERTKQPERLVRQSLHAYTVELPDVQGGTMSVRSLIAREIDALEGRKHTEWRLLTNRRISTLEQAAELIE